MYSKEIKKHENVYHSGTRCNPISWRLVDVSTLRKTGFTKFLEAHNPLVYSRWQENTVVLWFWLMVFEALCFLTLALRLETVYPCTSEHYSVFRLLQRVACIFYKPRYRLIGLLGSGSRSLFLSYTLQRSLPQGMWQCEQFDLEPFCRPHFQVLTLPYLPMIVNRKPNDHKNLEKYSYYLPIVNLMWQFPSNFPQMMNPKDQIPLWKVHQ